MKKEYVNQDKAFIFDLDQTLIDSTWTQRHLEKYQGDYEKMYQALGNQDKIISETKELIDTLFFAGFKIIILSVRLEKSRQRLIEWLEANKFYHYKAYDIILCHDKWHERAETMPEKVKKKLYMEFIEPKNYKIMGFFDDNIKNIEMFESLGVPSYLIKAKLSQKG